MQNDGLNNQIHLIFFQKFQKLDRLFFQILISLYFFKQNALNTPMPRLQNFAYFLIVIVFGAVILIECAFILVPLV